MKRYVIADLRNFQILGEYHTHKQAMKYLESEFAGWDFNGWEFSVCTKKQFANAETQAYKDAQASCGVCNKQFFPNSHYLEDAVCDSCKYTRTKDAESFLLDYAKGG
ncbi:MAG: hypothetical protein ABIF12_00695 [bacterium]